MRRMRVVLVIAALIAAVGVWSAAGAEPTNQVTANEQRREGFRAAHGLAPTLRQSVEGREWSAVRFENDLGEPCVQVRSPYGWSVGNCPALRDGALATNIGGTPNVTYLFGLASEQVEAIELVLADCSRQAVGVASGAFFHVLPSSLGRIPYKLVARGDRGSLIESDIMRGARSTSGC